MPNNRHKLKLGLVGAIAAVLLGPSGSEGTTASVPKVSESSLVGIWESISPGRTEVVRMEIRKDGSSYIALAIRAAEPAEAAIFLVKALDVRDGKVDIRADDLTKESKYSIVVQMKGRADGGWGLLEGKTVLRDRSTGHAIRELGGAFVRSDGGYIHDLARLSEAAEQAIQTSDKFRHE